MACRLVAVTRSRPSAARGERGVDRREHSMYSAAGLAAGWTRAGSVPGGLRSEWWGLLQRQSTGCGDSSAGNGMARLHAQIRVFCCLR